MLSSTLNPSIPSTARAAAAAILTLTAAVSPAHAIVVEGLTGMTRPANSVVGMWSGSSGVPVAPHWFITAKHTGGGVGGGFYCSGSWFTAVEVREHPTLDLQLIRVAERFPTWHRIASGVVAGDPCVMAGWGVTAAAALPNNAGYDWSGTHQETWGANVIQGASSILSVRFDAPGTGNAVPFEASYAVNDSGGGLFTWGADGELELAAVAVSVSGFGLAAYGQSGYAIRIEPVISWITEAVDPSMPVASSIVAPRASLLGPGWVAGAAALSALCGLRRRRR